jgi:hypothetical protein
MGKRAKRRERKKELERLNIIKYGYSYRLLKQLETTRKPYIGGWFHLREQMLKRFNYELSLTQYYKRYVVKKEPSKFSKKGVKVRDGEMVFIYMESSKYKYPITVYKINRKDDGRLVKKHRGLIKINDYKNEKTL